MENATYFSGIPVDEIRDSCGLMVVILPWVWCSESAQLSLSLISYIRQFWLASIRRSPDQVPLLHFIWLTRPEDVYNFILDLEVYLFHVAVSVATGLLVLKHRRPELPRSLKEWLPTVWLRINLSWGVIVPTLLSRQGCEILP